MKRKQRRESHKVRNALIAVAAIIMIIIATIGAIIWMNPSANNGQNGSNGGRVLLVTSLGNITIELYDDMPITTANFKNLVSTDIYDNTTFHRVIADFMIQGGDPTGTGYGDPSIPTIQDEFSSNSYHNENNNGTIAMANANDPAQGIYNTGSSQFFINVANNNHLDGKHPVFGKVIEGMSVVVEISKVPTTGPTGSLPDSPLSKVTLIKAEIIS